MSDADAESMVRVVLVDDNESLRGLLGQVLDMEPGFEVVGEAADGRQGMAVAATTSPDVVVSDVRMPVLNGAEAVQGYRAAAPGAAVVLMSTMGQDEGARAAAAVGADAYISKQADPDEIVAMLRRAAGR